MADQDQQRQGPGDVREVLRASWGRLVQMLGVDPEAAGPVFAALVQAHSEPGRYYHTLEHVRQVLGLLDAFGGRAADPAALHLAAWFHDVVYNPRANDNEERSARYARETLGRLAVTAERIARVARLILATKNHRPAEGDADSGLFLDADLAILGAPEEEYQAYAGAIRREYDWVSDAAYRAGRTEVLRSFLRRPRIYFTEGFFAAREDRARSNMEKEIAALSTGGGPHAAI
jgi:predicted metal-dependent HD superfamily phosphohydrolase